ncbi:hypothetical protein [Helicobacter sp. T3_23-1059]
MYVSMYDFCRSKKMGKFPLILLINLIFLAGFASALDLLEVSQNLNVKKERSKKPDFCSFAVGKKGNPPKLSSANRIACYKNKLYTYNTRKSQELTPIIPEIGSIACACNSGNMLAKVKAISLFGKTNSKPKQKKQKVAKKQDKSAKTSQDGTQTKLAQQKPQ